MSVVPAQRAGGASYIPFVDGLRAVAIISVVGYHIGLPGFAGGYVGVDVFFVISGFLIISHIVNQIAQGRFFLADFYARRILRILPVLLIVLATSCWLGIFALVTPDGYRNFGRSETAAAFMASNNFFLSGQGYFDTAADTKPLLHTWSLGVEMQFYLVAPLLIWLVQAPFGRDKGKTLLLIGGTVMAIASFIGCVVFTDVNYDAAFFLTPYRAWEFIAGAAVAPLVILAARLPTWMMHPIGVAGLAVIVGCAVFYTGASLYPSWFPLPPVLGTVAVIVAGQTYRSAIVRRFLEAKPFVGIGLVSYGWYLWHWPLLTFGRLYHFGTHNLAMDTLTGGVVALMLSIVTYVTIERPVSRARKWLQGRGQILTIAGGIVACLLIALPGKILATTVAGNVAERLTPLSWPQKTFFKNVSDSCVVVDNALPTGCIMSAGSNGLLIGDSHAREAYPVLVEKTRQAGVSLITAVQSGCPPLLTAEIVFQGQVQNCAISWQKIYASIEKRHQPIDFAIIQSSFGMYVGGENAARLLAEPGSARPLPDQYAALTAKLSETIDALRDLGVKRFLLLAPEPRFHRDAPECLLRAKKMLLPPDVCSRPLADVDVEHRRVLSVLQAVAGQSSDIKLIDPFPLFCDAMTCRQHQNGVPLYIDGNHLSRVGNELVYGTFADDLTWTFHATPTAME